MPHKLPQISKQYIKDVLVEDTLHYMLNGAGMNLYMTSTFRQQLEYFSMNLSAWDRIEGSGRTTDTKEIREGRAFSFNVPGSPITAQIVFQFEIDMKLASHMYRDKILYVYTVLTNTQLGSDEQKHSYAHSVTSHIDMKKHHAMYTKHATVKDVNQFLYDLEHTIAIAEKLIDRIPNRHEDMITTMPQHKTKQHPYLV